MGDSESIWSIPDNHSSSEVFERDYSLHTSFPKNV